VHNQPQRKLELGTSHQPGVGNLADFPYHCKRNWVGQAFLPVKDSQEVCLDYIGPVARD
jgi:hypothetical protein